jgi:predicted KAP-like P-loop ATPase
MQDKKETTSEGQVVLNENIWESYMLTPLILGVSQCLIKRELIQNLQFPVGRSYESITFMPQVIDKCRRLIKIPYVGYYYRQRKNSITHTKDLKQEKDLIEGYAELYFIYKDKYPDICADIKKFILNKAKLILYQANGRAEINQETMKDYFSDRVNFSRLYRE